MATTAIMCVVNAAAAAPVVLTIESWRNDDLAIWRDKIIPVFEKAHPDIKVKFAPTAPAEYNAVLNSKLAAGSAGDLITCRPFDVPLQHFQKGYLLGLNDLKGTDNFTQVAKTAWTTDDGKTTFCVPIAAVMHGFMYNKDAFKGEAPKSWNVVFEEMKLPDGKSNKGRVQAYDGPIHVADAANYLMKHKPE